MCGIGGMLGNPDSAIIERMNSIMHHRGPDGNDVWVDENISLGHTRLAIVDIDGSDQPILSQSGNVLVANGEIYNHQKIRTNNTQYPWNTNGDSETILALHESAIAKSQTILSAKQHATWISQLNGMYAIAIWNPKDKQLILARDPMGIKPLVRTEVDGSLLFASEAKALRAHEGHIPQIDELALIARLAWEYPLDGTTLLKGVAQVRPGTVETWSLDESGFAILTGKANVEMQKVDPASDWYPDTEASKLLESFVVSVEERLMSDVPVGIVLSGGLDSSLVAAVAHEAAERSSNPVPACWTVAESEDNPDWQAAELVASTLELEHHQHILQEDSFDKMLPDLAWHGEDLDVTVLFFQPLFEKMSQSVTVGLCGQGADELHAGYPRYRDLNNHSSVIQSRLDSINHSSKSIIEEGQLPVGDYYYCNDHSATAHTSSLDEFLQFELDGGQLSNFQLRLVDRHSMAHSLEVRVPFLGKSHRQASHKLPMNWRLPPSMEEKAALRRAADLTKLPAEIVRRPKLPAGTATSPKLLQQMLAQLDGRAQQIMRKYPLISGAFKDQPELAIGLGLFEAMHILDGGRSKRSGTAIDLLDEVM
jgi:asparagine synthase (glutamine-hydrolysing)